MSRLILSILIGLLLSGFVWDVSGQEKPTKSSLTNLAIEIVDGHKRTPAPVFEPPSEAGFMETGPTNPLPNRKQTTDAAPLTRIRIRSIMEGDAVRIKVAAVFDDSEPVDAPGPKYGPVEKAVGSYLAREGETVKVTELTGFGFEPLVLKIVRAEPPVDEASLGSTPPQVTNDLKAVEVVSFLPSTLSSNSYRLTVRNISSKNIVALDVYQPEERGRSGVTALGDAVHPVMKPGATYETWISETRGGRMTDQGYLPDQSSHKLIVGTVVFDDGTYEGETETAAGIIARQQGRRLQLARALPLLQAILEAPGKDPAAMLERLRVEVSGLRIDVDGAVADDLTARFPELLKNCDRKCLTTIVMQGLKQGRDELLNRVKDVENVRKANPDSLNFVWQQLNSLREKLETEVGTMK